MFRFYALMMAVGLICSCGKDEDEDSAAPKPFKALVKDAGVNGSAAAAPAEAGAFSPDNQVSLTAFGETMWPVLRQHCGGCHGGSTSPFFAVDDKYQAHKTVIESHLVAPAAAPSSRFVTRLSLNNHNCWSECPNDAQTMLASIKAWTDKAGIKSGGDNLIRVGPVAVATRKTITLMGGGGNWVREAENFDALGAGFEVVEDGTASAKKVLGLVPVAEGQEAPAGESRYEMVIPEGKYNLWMRLRNTERGRAVWFRLNGGREVQAGIEGNSDDWVWVKVADGVDLAPLKGADYAELAITRSQVLVDMVAFTTNAVFDQAQIENTGRRQALEWDLTPALGKKAVLTMLIDPTPDGTAYLLSRPTLRLDEPTKVKLEKMYVLNNGEYNPQYSTFASLSTTVAATTELSPRGLVVIARDGNDAITLGFGGLAIVP